MTPASHLPTDCRPSSLSQYHSHRYPVLCGQPVHDVRWRRTATLSHPGRGSMGPLSPLTNCARTRSREGGRVNISAISTYMTASQCLCLCLGPLSGHRPDRYELAEHVIRSQSERRTATLRPCDHAGCRHCPLLPLSPLYGRRGAR